MRSALSGVDGVVRVDIVPGDADFAVFFDRTKLTADAVAEKLQAAGEDAEVVR